MHEPSLHLGLFAMQGFCRREERQLILNDEELF